MNLTKDIQIKAILNAEEWKLAEENGFKDPKDFPWSITDEDVKIYINKHGFPKGWVYFSKHTYDGIYILEENDKWVLKDQERAVVYFQKEFETKEQALDFVIETYFLKNTKKA